MNKANIYFYVLSLILLLVSCSENSGPMNESPGVVRGVVKNSSTNTNIKDVFIYTIPWSFADSSNTSGRFELQDLPAGEYFVFAQKDSFEVERQKTIIRNGQTKELVFNLRQTFHKNTAPNKPYLKLPESGVTNIRDSVILTWWATKDVDGDPVFYDVYLDENASPYTRIYEELSDTTCIVKNLEPASTYFWRVLASDKEKVSDLSSIYRFTTLGFKNYVVTLPEGKLPYPHHDPDYTENEYNAMMDNLMIVDNYCDYVYDEQKPRLSMGFAIDVGEDTPLYSITAGTVKFVQRQSSDGSHLIIEDYENPGYGWIYRYIKNISVSYGDLIPAGFKIAEVNDEYNGRYSIERAFSFSSNGWLKKQWLHQQPDKYFIYEDTLTPRSGYIYIFKENSNEILDISGWENWGEEFNGPIYGKVDIGIWLSDFAEFTGQASSPDDINGKYINISKIKYTIKSYERNAEFQFDSFDFSELELSMNDRDVLFVPWSAFTQQQSTGAADPKNNRVCIVTNCKRVNGVFSMNYSYTWDTAERKEDGSAKYPNGWYVIDFELWDFKGNKYTGGSMHSVDNPM